MDDGFDHQGASGNNEALPTLKEYCGPLSNLKLYDYMISMFVCVL